MFCKIWPFQLRNTLKLWQKKKILYTIFKNYFSFLEGGEGFDVVFHMFMGIKNTFNQFKNHSLDQTGEGNVVSDLAISALKIP